MLSLWAYSRYAEAKATNPPSRVQNAARGRRRVTRKEYAALRPVVRHPSRYYGLALLFFGLGLMSKPMLVTLPLVLLLLDFWPLLRFQIEPSPVAPKGFLHLVLEKIPFILLSAIASGATFCIQQKAGAIGESPLANRVGNALISYVRYVGKLFWPDNLALFYPRPAEWPIGMVFGAAAVLFAVSVSALWIARQRPYFAVGWFWFLGTLLPVIGVVQAGEQAMADRYTYLPFVGLFIVISWGVAEATAGWRDRKPLLAGAAILVLGACCLRTRVQLAHWQTSESLLKHALVVTTNNAVAHNNLGTVFEERGDFEAALWHYSEALKIQTNYTDAHVNVGIQLARQGRIDEALGHFYAALALNASAKVQYNLGNALLDKGDWNEAASHLASALEQEPDFAEAHYNLGLALFMQRNSASAVTHYREAVRLKPDWPAALKELAWILATDPETQIRNGPEAVRLAERASNLTGRRDIAILGSLDAAYAEVGRFADAIATANRARELALAAGQSAAAAQVESRLKLYESGQPYRRK
jgi:tetratricopeptide (TPR) repeat protein